MGNASFQRIASGRGDSTKASGMRSLVWFRSDLRVRDNRALHHACREADDGVVGVFLLAPGQWRRHRWAGCKVEFVLRTLASLGERLEELNIPLIVATADRFAEAPTELLKIAQRAKCGSVHFNREYEIDEARRDEAAARVLEGAGVRVHPHHDQLIVPPGEVMTGEGRFFTVFTPFKKRWLLRVGEETAGRGVALASGSLRRQAAIDVKGVGAPRSVPGFSSNVPADLWPGGEKEASQRLGEFVGKKLGAYADERDAPGTDGTSRLSAYLAVGAISARQCLRAALEANNGKLEGGDAGASRWISELAWRDFYKHIVVGYPRVCMGRAFKTATDSIRWSYDTEMFAAWCEGRTGVPIVDAGMRQLKAEGWMHNRLRMVTAMYLTKDLFIDWRWGEKHFMEHLVDGDFASNNGGWQWSASTGTDAAPYFRIFNPTSQSRTHDADGAFIRKHVPEMAALDSKSIHDPPPMARMRLNYPQPIVDHRAARERVMREFKRVGT